MPRAASACITSTKTKTMRSRRGGAATIAVDGRRRCCRRSTTRPGRSPGANSASVRSGLLSTAGNVLFAGDASSNLVAFDAAKGVPIWHDRLHASISNGPITYQLGSAQYVVVGAGDTLYSFKLP